jgi:hypothetical protein
MPVPFGTSTVSYFCLATAAIALLLALAMQWLPARATSVALGLAAAMTLLPMALLRRPQRSPFRNRRTLDGYHRRT